MYLQSAGPEQSCTVRLDVPNVEKETRLPEDRGAKATSGRSWLPELDRGNV